MEQNVHNLDQINVDNPNWLYLLKNILEKNTVILNMSYYLVSKHCTYKILCHTHKFLSCTLE
uniref:Uncharacterized protein n=1 Tax=Anguilla anguilla TaxID=7936 RepID=A0A0E9RQZ2_ANGAN